MGDSNTANHSPAMRRNRMEGAALETPRKLLKPQVEKRRRERINNSLEKLRMFLSQVMKNEKLQNPKIEKAEILEYTVQFLQSVMKPSEMSQDNSSQEYQSGFQHCLQTTLHLINSSQQTSYANKDFLFQQLSQNHPELSSSLDHQCLTLHGLSPTFGHKASTHFDCSINPPGDQNHNLVNAQNVLSSDQQRSSWRPWV